MNGPLRMIWSQVVDQHFGLPLTFHFFLLIFEIDLHLIWYTRNIWAQNCEMVNIPLKGFVLSSRSPHLVFLTFKDSFSVHQIYSHIDTYQVGIDWWICEVGFVYATHVFLPCCVVCNIFICFGTSFVFGKWESI